MNGWRMLVAGDLHLGRSSSRVAGDGGRDVSARGAWERLVEAAVRERVGLVCMTGDIADADNRFWEALGPLEDGIGRLAAAGIPVVAVAGNHDHDVLPRLARRLDPAAFRLLGAEGRWERWTHVIEGRPVVHLDGWSFPRERVSTSPVKSYAPVADPRTPTLAMVHGDLDVPDSPYAPLERARLRAAPVAGWLLGHIHAPRRDDAEDGPFITYPGSPQALDPGERGPHGAVLVGFQAGRLRLLDRVPLSSVRYDEVAVDLDGVAAIEELDERVHAAVEGHGRAALAEGGDVLDLVSLRLRLVGRTALARRLREEAGRLESFTVRVAGVDVAVERVQVHVRPAVDLEEQSCSPSPPGRLARLLLELDVVEGDPSAGLSPGTHRLLEDARRRMESRRRDAAYADLQGEPVPSDAEVRQCIRGQAEALLAQLLEAAP